MKYLTSLLKVAGLRHFSETELILFLILIFVIRYLPAAQSRKKISNKKSRRGSV
uniref:Uncharacterized protein n=1 Tax=Arundo donax TaxID=35708 RepID=A0A0A9SET4_ARUDO